MSRLKTYKIWIFVAILIAGIVCVLFFNNHINQKTDFVSGRVVKIYDGDTYDLLLDDKTTIRVRMDGIDAPERGMPFSKKAKKYLGELCESEVVRISINNVDHYGRTISFSYLKDGRELSQEMLKAGFAWHYKKYNSDPELAALEDGAREAKLGLWQDKNPIAPWDVRKLHRQGASTKGTYETIEVD